MSRRGRGLPAVALALPALAFALLVAGARPAAAQSHGGGEQAPESRPAAATGSTHGIVREPRPSGDGRHGIVGDAEESRRARSTGPEGVVPLAPPSSAEAVAAAVAKAVKAVDEKRAAQPRAGQPRQAAHASPASARAGSTPARRDLAWPERRAVVRWAWLETGDRVELAWPEAPIDIDAESADTP